MNLNEVLIFGLVLLINRIQQIGFGCGSRPARSARTLAAGSFRASCCGNPTKLLTCIAFMLAALVGLRFFEPGIITHRVKMLPALKNEIKKYCDKQTNI